MRRDHLQFHHLLIQHIGQLAEQLDAAFPGRVGTHRLGDQKIHALGQR